MSIHDTISKNTSPLFKCQQPKQISKASLKLTAVTSDRYLFSRLYIASQQRDGDLEEFFKQETQPYPPSLSEFGNLQFGKKSDLIACVNKETLSPQQPASYHVKVFDVAAIVHALSVSSIATFSEYADTKFLPFLKNHLKSTKRIDVVWRCKLLRWSQLTDRRLYFSLIECYKLLFGLNSLCLCDFFDFASKRTRSNHNYKLQVKLANCNCYKYSFFVKIIREWNDLPAKVVEVGNLRRFKIALKSYVYFLGFFSNLESTYKHTVLIFILEVYLHRVNLLNFLFRVLLVFICL